MPKRTSQTTQMGLVWHFLGLYIHKFENGDQVQMNYRKNATKVSSYVQLERYLGFDLFYSFFLILKNGHLRTRASISS